MRAHSQEKKTSTKKECGCKPRNVCKSNVSGFKFSILYAYWTPVSSSSIRGNNLVASSAGDVPFVRQLSRTILE